MTSFADYTRMQYELVLESRKLLLDYCKTISPEHLHYQNPSFGRGGSIRNLLVHNANTYMFWLGINGLKKDIRFFVYEEIEGLEAIEAIYAQVNDIVYEFLQFTGREPMLAIAFEIDGFKGETSSLKLFTHVTTHEFHHKGQILSMSRHLGYTPVDTDIMV